MSKVPEKIDFMKLALELSDREEQTVSKIEDLNVYVTSYLGEYPAHKHPKAEFFFILDGELELEFNGRPVVLRKGEGLKVPKETVHKPYAKSRALVMKIEPVEFPFEKV
jgi:mannose-6-phosphate isomerase-like protein (cupin superfamily)